MKTISIYTLHALAIIIFYAPLCATNEDDYYKTVGYMALTAATITGGYYLLSNSNINLCPYKVDTMIIENPQEIIKNNVFNNLSLENNDIIISGSQKSVTFENCTLNSIFYNNNNANDHLILHNTTIHGNVTFDTRGILKTKGKTTIMGNCNYSSIQARTGNLSSKNVCVAIGGSTVSTGTYPSKGVIAGCFAFLAFCYYLTMLSSKVTS
jgi:hypothetical protein